MVAQDSEYQRLVAALELAIQAADSPEVQALEARLQQEPDNGLLKRDLAIPGTVKPGVKKRRWNLLLGLLSRIWVSVKRGKSIWIFWQPCPGEYSVCQSLPPSVVYPAVLSPLPHQEATLECPSPVRGRSLSDYSPAMH